MHRLLLGSEAVHHVLPMHAPSAQARLSPRGVNNESPELSCNVHIAAHCCMADPRSIRHIEAMRELYARISSQRVLCIDNNPYFRDFVCWFLSDVGCEVRATASEALSVIRQKPSGYDLLIVADWLPDRDGVELLQTLRSDSLREANCRHRAAVVAQATSHLRLLRSFFDSDNTCWLLRTHVNSGTDCRHRRHERE
jgi:CheY-like chemotaxis protein